MLGKDRRICPCCGKVLKLIPPSEELLPNRFGISKNGIPFYLISDNRFFPYTIYPESFSKFRTSSIYECGKIKPYLLCVRSMLSARCPRYKMGLKLIALQKSIQMLKKDRLFSFGGWAMAFFCENCKAKLAINFNPLTILDNLNFWLIVYTIIIPFIMFEDRQLYIIVLALIPIIIYLITGILSLLALFYLKLFMSNFVITDIHDAMVTPASELELSRKSLKQRYLHKSNVFNTEICGEIFCLYLTNVGKSYIKMHICGIDGEQKRMLQLIGNEMARNGKAMLPLSFEGKYVGNAEIIVANEVVNSPPLIYRQPLGDNESVDQH